MRTELNEVGRVIVIDEFSELTFTQWGLSRHSNTSNNFESSATLSEDINYSLTGKNVDIVIMDTGVSGIVTYKFTRETIA